MMAEPKDDADAAHFMDKIANHLGNSGLEENLNDFLEQHSEELVLELRREDSSQSTVQHEGLEQEAQREELGEEKQEEASMARGEGAEDYQDGGGHLSHFSQRVHELYQEFLKIMQSNLEEFLQAEGLTETQLRDACKKEMRAKGGRGDCFMHTLISSWEFSSFIALVSDFADEGMGSEDEEEEEDREDDTDGGGASVDAARSFTHVSRLDDGAGSFDNMSSSREVIGERRLLRSHNRRCPRGDRSSSSSANSSESTRRSPSPPAAGTAPDDALAGRRAAVVAGSGNLSDGAKDGAAGVRIEQRRPDGSGRAGDGDIPGGFGSKGKVLIEQNMTIHSNSRRGSKEAVSWCDDAYRGDDGVESQRARGSARIEAGVGPGIQELSMRAEAKR